MRGGLVRLAVRHIYSPRCLADFTADKFGGTQGGSEMSLRSLVRKFIRRGGLARRFVATNLIRGRFLTANEREY